jgi:hypothetical protein
MQPDQVKAKLDASLFIPFAEFVHSHERRAKKESKNKKGKTSTSYSTIKATKPSTLATVAPWERDSVSEMYDTSWNDLHELEEKFKKTPPLEINYNEVSNKLTSIIERQWSDKQSVLRKTKHRTVMSSQTGDAQQWKKLNDVRSILTELKTLEAVPSEDLRLLSPYMLLPSGNVTLPDGYTAPYSTAFKQGMLNDKFPNMAMLIALYETRLTSVSGIPAE